MYLDGVMLATIAETCKCSRQTVVRYTHDFPRRGSWKHDGAMIRAMYLGGVPVARIIELLGCCRSTVKNYVEDLPRRVMSGRKTSVNERREIREKFLDGYLKSELIKFYGVSREHLDRILNGVLLEGLPGTVD